MRIAIVLLVAAVLLAGCTINPQESAPSNGGNGTIQGQPGGQVAGGTNNTQGNASSGTGASPTLFTMEEVAKHNTKADCWMVIDKYVLDLSAYRNHPGGDTYVAYCGMNATEGFATKGGEGRDHSQRAYDEASGYIIGVIGQPMPFSAGSG